MATMDRPNQGSSYVPLWCKSNYSFLEGAGHPEEVVERAAALRLPAVALTDRDGVYGIVRAHGRARALGIYLVVGAQVTVEDGSCVVLLAQDRSGYANLCRLLTASHRHRPPAVAQVERRGGKPPLPAPAEGARRSGAQGRGAAPCVSWTEVAAHAGGLLGLWGGSPSLLAGAAPVDGVAGELRDAFGDRLYALVARHLEPRERAAEARIRQRANRFGLPVVVATEVLYPIRSGQALQDVVTCIRHHVSLATAGRRLRPNGEHHLRDPATCAALFADDPAAVARTVEVAQRCSFSLAEIDYRYPVEAGGMARLRALTLAGARRRYGGLVPPPVRRQLAHELRLIGELGYGGYFLTMKELVDFCHDQSILCQGRGSAANSAVCYCLGITAIDPVRMELLFERFLSRERAEPPDIDLDIQHHRREEVIQHLYARFGRERAAMVANVVRYRPRSAVRDVGGTLGLPATALDRLARHLAHHGEVGRAAVAAAGLDPEAPAVGHLLRLANQLLGAPRHLSIHPGGFLLGATPVSELVPIEPAAMAGRTVVQWDKYDVEALALFKVDLLALGALTHLDLCFRLLREERGIELEMATIPPADAATFAMASAGDTVGVFQIESRAQMAMLPRLAPRCFYDLVIEIALVRPGPISGGMVHPYLRRRSGGEPVTFPHPSLAPVLGRTLGIPLFQEQVMRLAVVAADYTPGEADQLRRAMGAWARTGALDDHRERLIARMVAKGIAREFAAAVFEQIRGFGEYGFPESHAASFALIAYATCYLKRHFPVEFTCALLNAQPMGFYPISTIVADAQRHGVEVRPVAVGASRWESSLEPRLGTCLPGGGGGGQATAIGGDRKARGASPPEGCGAGHGRWGVAGVGCELRGRGGVGPRPQGCGSGGTPKADPPPPAAEAAGGGWRDHGADPLPFAVRLGLHTIAGLSRAEGERIVAVGGATHLDGFVRAAGLARATLERLAEAGGLAPFGVGRRAALWQVATAAPPLCLAEPAAPPFAPLDLGAEIAWDYRTTGCSTHGHPLGPLRQELRAAGIVEACEVAKAAHGARLRYAGAVLCRQRPTHAAGTCFMTLEDETGLVNVVVWRRIFARYAEVIRTAPLVAVGGRIERRGEVVHLLAERLWQPQLAQPVVTAASRDFR